MSQDNSPKKPLDSKSPDTSAAPDTPVDSGKAASFAADANRLESGVNDQPIDALRQASDQGRAQKNQAVIVDSSSERSAKSSGKAMNEPDPKADRASKAPGGEHANDKPAPSQASKLNFTLGSKSTMNSPKQTTLKEPSAWRGVWGGVVLGLVLVAVALGVGLWWQQQRFETVAREMAVRLQQSDKLVTQANQNASQALSLANGQREALDQLTRELSVTSNELKTLQQAWQAANEGLDQTLLLNDLRRLINMANQELVLFGNVTSAVSILASVQSMLQAQTVPALRSLLQAVTTDLARLRALPQVDVAILSANLDSLIVLTGKAPLLVPEASRLVVSSGAGATDRQADRGVTDGAGLPAGRAKEGSVSAEPDSVDAPWWQQAAGAVERWSSEAATVMAREFSDLLSIRKADDPQALLLSEDQAVQLRANVRAMLLSAQLALMTRQADIWRSELIEVQSLLNTRYDTQALDTKASLKLLDELMQAPVASQVPDISATLSALAAANRTLSVPKVSTESGSSNAPQGDRGEADIGKTVVTNDSSSASPASESSSADGSVATTRALESGSPQSKPGDADSTAEPASAAAGQGS